MARYLLMLLALNPLVAQSQQPTLNLVTQLNGRRPAPEASHNLT